MDDYCDPEPESQAPEMDDQDDRAQHFCKLTFGQFFTLVVLLVITVCGAFYLGARYGNQYLRLDGLPADEVATASALQRAEPSTAAALPESIRNDAELKRLAREALTRSQQDRLEAQARGLLASGQVPSAAAIAAAAALEPEPDVPDPAFAERQAADARRGPEEDPAAAVTEPTAASEPDAAETQALLKAAEAAGVDVSGVREQLLEEAAVARGPASNPQPPVTNHAVSPPPAEPSVRNPPAELSELQGASGLPYAIQVGAYRDAKEARHKVSEWKTRGYSAYVISSDLGDKGQWYRVRIGAFATRGEASNFLTELKGRETADGIVVQNE
ncbi:MAG: SPOR domain-containing protein [Deltaproteobacteria bacterium]|nr:SPOR domain-containing protein [Deltaproteobacteria bacterium]